MDLIPKSHIARVVLAYLYEQKLNRAAEVFCKTSPYLKEERQILKYGSRPTMIFHAKLVDLFREYGEIQIKVNNFLEKHGGELNVPSDATLVRKVDCLLWAAARKGRRQSTVGDGGEEQEKVPRSVRSKRHLAGPSPQPSLSSSTPEVSEPKPKRVRLDNSFIVLNESRNLSNLSQISAITDGDSTQDSVGEEAADADCKQEEQDAADAGKSDEEELTNFPSIELFSQTLLENENYSMKIADLINKGLETSTNAPVDPKEGPSSVQAQTNDVAAREQQNENQSFNFNFEDLISNIVNSAVQDPVFDGIMEDITSKAIKTQNEKESEEVEISVPQETPLKERLRKTCKKNYNPVSGRKSARKVKVISDVPFYGTIPEVVKSEASIVQPEVSSTEDQPMAATMAGTTQFYVIQPDNTTKLIDINQLQFPTQQINIPEVSSFAQGTPTLVSIPNSGCQEPTYYLSYFIDAASQLPEIPNCYSAAFTDQIVAIPPTSLPSESSSLDKFLIFPAAASSSAVSSVSSNSITTSITTAARGTCTTTSASMTTSSTISSTFVPIQMKPEINTATPQNVIVSNPRTKCASTPSRKAAHIRFLNFHTPGKQLASYNDPKPRITSPISAPPSVDQRKSRIIIVPQSPSLESIAERAIPELESSSTSVPTLTGDWDSVHGLNAITSCSISGTPRVAKDPRTCVRVLSRSASEDGDEPVCTERQPTPAVVATPNPAPKPMVEIPASEVSRKKLSTPSVNAMDLEEWRRIRSVSKKNFDQHLRLVEEQRQQTNYRPKVTKKRVKKQVKKSAPVEINLSTETIVVEDNSSFTEEHARMLEQALLSPKKDTAKTPAKTPAKGRTPKDVEVLRQDKIYVKIATPKKRTPTKATPKRRMSKGRLSAKKRRISSARKSEVVEEKEDDENKKVAELEVLKSGENPVEDVYVTPPEPSKAENESLNMLVQQKVSELTPEEQKQKSQPQQEEEQEQEQTLEPANTTNPQKTDGEKPSDLSFNVSQLETPYKLDLEGFPATPRFLVPSQIPITPMVKTNRDTGSCDESSSLTKAGDIQTPNFPITPGLVSTPKSVNSVSPQSHMGSGFPSRRTDYSSGSSYYKPDESEDLDKNLEAMLSGDRKKPQPEPILPKVEPPREPPPPPSPEKDPPPPPPPEKEESPQKPRDRSPSPANSARSSSTDSSSSSDSSSDSSNSSSESSPEKEKAPTQPSKPASPLPAPDNPQNSLNDARRQQMAELEAKKQRTIARMKNTKAPTSKKIDHKLSDAQKGKKSSNAIIAQRKKLLQAIARPPLGPNPANPPGRSTTKAHMVTSTTSSKRKNPTPRKLVLLDQAISQPVKKHSPKRKPPVQKAPSRVPLATPDQDVSKIVTAKKDLVIEGTYENENLSRLCYTPEREQEYRASKLPETRIDDGEPNNVTKAAANESTPDSNKENRIEGNGDADDVDDTGEEDEEEDEYENCSLRTVSEETSSGAYLQFVYDGKKSAICSLSTPRENRVIKKFNVVLEDRKICLQPQESFSLFEQAPKRATSSSVAPKKDSKSVKSSSKKATGKSGSSAILVSSTKTETEKKAEKESESQSVPGKVKAKINVISVVRDSAHPAICSKKVVQHYQKTLQTTRQSRVEALSKGGEKKDEGTVKTVPRAETDGEKTDTLVQCASPSPKMPLKLNMKKSKQAISSTTTSTNVVPHDKSSQAQPPPSSAKSVDPKRSKEKSQQQQNIQEDDIAAVLSHLHGSQE